MGPNTKWYLTNAELNWIVLALNHEIASLRYDADNTDSDLVRKLGRRSAEGREELVTKITDFMSANAKRIEII